MMMPLPMLMALLLNHDDVVDVLVVAPVASMMVARAPVASVVARRHQMMRLPQQPLQFHHHAMLHQDSFSVFLISYDYLRHPLMRWS